MAFKDLVRQERQKGSGILSSVGSAAAGSARESLDIRNALFSSGSFLNTLFPKVKGFKAGNNVGKGKSPSILSTSGSDMSSSKLDEIGQNTKIAAKNSFVLPAMARDMNVMRQNIVKLVKLQGGTASTKADMFFMKSGEREAAYESKMASAKSSTSPTKVGGESTGGGLSGVQKLLIALGALLAIGIYKLFTDKELRDKVATYLKEMFTNMMNSAMDMFSTNIISPETLAAASSLSLMIGSIVGSLVSFGKAIAPLARKLGLLGAVISLILGKREAERMYEINKKRNKFLATKDEQYRLTPEEEVLWQEDNKKTLEMQGMLDELQTGNADASPPPPRPGSERDAFGRYEQEYIDDPELQRPPAVPSPTPKPTPPPAPSPTPSPTPAPAPAPAAPAPVSSSSPSQVNVPELMAKIRKAEGGSAGYNAVNKGKAGDTPGGMPGLSNLTVGEVRRLQKSGEIFAAGAYQVIPNTMDMILKNGVAKESDKFDAETQDKMGRWLINRRIRMAERSGTNPQLEISKEFASVADPNTGESYYADRGNNKASIASLDGAVNTRGTTLNSGSVQVADGRMAMGSGQSVIVNAPQTNVQQGSSNSGNSGNIPSVVDTDFMRHLVAQMAV
jgi:hypothetical protein